MKKSCIIIFIIALAVQFIQPVEKETLVKIPVRVFTAGSLEKNLEKKDLSLSINGEKREIIEFFAMSRSPAQVKLNRNFILAFSLTDYNPNIAAAVSYFVNNILNESDRLIVCSPLKKIYRIDNGSDKKKVVDAVEKIFKEDISLYKQELERAARNLENTARVLILNPGGIKYFLKTYTWQVTNYNERFVFPDFDNYNEIASFLAGDRGEKWLINFQERRILPSYRDFPPAEKQVKDFAAALGRKKKAALELAALIDSGLTAIHERMNISKSYPLETVSNFFLGLNIGCYVIFTGPETQAAVDVTASSIDAANEAYKHILMDLAGQTGGAAFEAANAADSMQAITGHVDYYYDIVFKLEGALEEKEIKVETLKPEADVFYKNKFTKEEIKTLLDAVDGTGIMISGDDLQGYSLRFKVSGFKLVPEEKSPDRKSGLVQVEIRLIDDRNEAVYQTGRSLKSSGDAIDISLRLPETYKGYFKLTIIAVDSIAGGKAEISKYIKLK